MKNYQPIAAQHGVSTPYLRRRAVREENSVLPIIDDWRLTQLAGSGATANVYFAQPVNKTSTTVSDYALKVLRPELEDNQAAKTRLVREVRALRAVSHPNLVSVLSSNFGNAKEAPPYLLLPRLRGATLDCLLDAGNRFDIPHALWIVRQVAEALGALHAAGWMHLDVKPENIAVDPSGHCTLFDLDLSLPTSIACGSEAQYSSVNCLRGTLEYTAPELLTSCCAAVPACDVYSLGVVLYRLIAGRHPFGCLTPEKLVEAHLQTLPPSPRTFAPTIPVEISRLVTYMLAKAPERRPSSTDELQNELARLEIQNFSQRGIEISANKWCLVGPCDKTASEAVAEVAQQG